MEDTAFGANIPPVRKHVEQVVNQEAGNVTIPLLSTVEKIVPVLVQQVKREAAIQISVQVCIILLIFPSTHLSQCWFYTMTSS